MTHLRRLRSVRYLPQRNGPSLLNDRHLLGMIVFRGYQKWLEAKATIIIRLPMSIWR
jgi:hypothetical protein